MVAASSTLVLVHLVTIGWLSLTMCGALGQFIPVLTGKPLRSDRLPLTILALLVAGLIALVLGFLRLGGSVRFQLPFLTVAALLLGAGVTLMIWNFACTLWSARPLGLSAQFVAVGLVAIGAAATVGVIFALVLDQVITRNALLLIHAGALPIHVIAGLGGWLTMTDARGSSLVRARISVSGRVQGVGYRAFTVRAASERGSWLP